MWTLSQIFLPIFVCDIFVQYDTEKCEAAVFFRTLQEAAIKEMEQEENNMLQEEGMQVDELEASQDIEREEKDGAYNPSIEEKKRKLNTNERKHKRKKCAK